MKSPFNRILVYDLETGGLKVEHNNITELAIVAVDSESLEIVEEFSLAIKPHLILEPSEDLTKEAKMLYKNLSTKSDDGNKYLEFGEKKLTVMNCVDELLEPLTNFWKHVNKTYKKDILKLPEILELLNNANHKHVAKLYFNNAYNPEALEVTHISTKFLIQEGVEYEDAYTQVKEMIARHKVGNSKPIIAGHNIGSLPRRIVKGKEVKPDGFDNPFMEKFFTRNNDDWFFSVNDLILDTLKMARLKWSELPSYNLGTCANEYGLTLVDAHRALPDTIFNAKVLIKMLRDLRGEGSGSSTYERKKFKLNY